VQLRDVQRACDQGEGLSLAHEVADGDLYLVDVVVVRDEAEPLGMVVDADVGSVAAGLDLDLHDAPAVGRVDAVPRFGGEVDRLVQAVGEVDVAAGRIRRIVRRNYLGRGARRRGLELPAPQRVEAPGLEE
jgi:hypothetical protein